MKSKQNLVWQEFYKVKITIGELKWTLKKKMKEGKTGNGNRRIKNSGNSYIGKPSYNTNI